MKKLALILALMIIPCSAFGLEMLSDSTMDTVTGQAGVNIAIDDIQMFINIEKLAWIDCDGFASWEGKGTCSGAGGAIVLNNFQIDVLNINAITGQTTAGATVAGANGLDLHSTSCGNIPLFYDYATTAVGDGCALVATGAVTGLQNLGLNNYTGADSTHSGSQNNYNFVPHFLTIDVTDELPASTEGFQFWQANPWTSAAVAAGTDGDATAASTVGGVLIGIPTVEIYINAMSLTPMYDGDLAGGTGSLAANDDDVVDVNGNHKTYGTVYMQGITFTTLSGWIEISPK
jgi:hypothetical protein